MPASDAPRPTPGFPVPSVPLTAPEVLDLEVQPTLVVRSEHQRMDDMATLMDGTFSHVPQALLGAGLHITGPAVALYRGVPGETVFVEVGFPVDRVPEGDIPLPGGLTAIASELPGGRAVRTSHLGGYDDLGSAWEGFVGSTEELGETIADPYWEIYVTEPTPDLDPAALRTDLVAQLADPADG